MENEIIRLLPAGPELAGPVTAYLQRSWDFLKAFEPLREEAYFTREYQQVLLEEEARAREAGTGFRFYIQPVGEPQTVIGSIGLNNVVWGAFRSAFLGYKLEEPRQGRGYMTMAVDMVVRHAFEDLGLPAGAGEERLCQRGLLSLLPEHQRGVGGSHPHGAHQLCPSLAVCKEWERKGKQRVRFP